MPRYEKAGTKFDNFVELLLDGPRVRMAKGRRSTGSKAWSMKDSDMRTYIFGGDQKKADASYKKQETELIASKFKLVSKQTPEITKYLKSKNK